MLEFPEFLQVVKNAPLVAIDLIIRDENGNFLLGLRLNNPAKGEWFVPGGRIMKNEPLDQAFRRISFSEIGFELRREDGILRGVYEHFYTTNAGDIPSFGTHYVVLAYEFLIKSKELSLPKHCQHSSWRWENKDSLVQDKTVNEFTKNYFM